MVQTSPSLETAHSRDAAKELLGYLRAQIERAYKDARPNIDRLFAMERDAVGRDWERIRDQRSQAIYDLERAVEPMKRQYIAIAEALADGKATPLTFVLPTTRPPTASARPDLTSTPKDPNP